MASQEVHKIVLVGGGAVGKTTLAFQFIQGKFVEDYDPTIEERYRKVIVVDEKACMLMVMDTAGQEEFSTIKDRVFSFLHFFFYNLYLFFIFFKDTFGYQN
eukprot:Anaeramoba_flamelloidesc40740_g1_i1.p1 GENE.c40740_g1_i1~~c40740_g1_i1.p1  ORF type:complete len:101 (+),score=19.23 c40740_g1_i1:12-314(+)